MVADQHAPGTYILLLELAQAQTIVVGGLGERAFAAGYYLYVGSAMRGLEARVARHLRTEKRLHWHIDYLRQQAPVREVWYAVGSERYECAWAQALAGAPGLAPCDAPFGASDCACRTHLFHSPTRLHLDDLRPLLPGGQMIQRLIVGAP